MIKKMLTYLGVLGCAGLTAGDGKCWEEGGGGLVDGVLTNCSLGLYWYQGHFYCRTKPSCLILYISGGIFLINWTLRKSRNIDIFFHNWIPPALQNYSLILKNLFQFCFSFPENSLNLKFLFKWITCVLNFEFCHKLQILRARCPPMGESKYFIFCLRPNIWRLL